MVTITGHVTVDGVELTPTATFTVTTAPDAARFPGDPGVGKILVGDNGDGQTDINDLDAWAMPTGKRHSCVRVYNGAEMALSASKRSSLIAYANQGRIPMLSVKGGAFSISQMANGDADATWTATAQWIKNSFPGVMWYSPVWHEPEDNFPSGPQADLYRTAYRRAVSQHMAVLGTGQTKVAFCGPWLMRYTYVTPNRDYRDWHPNWSGTAWLHDGPFDVLCTDGTIYHGSWIHQDAIDLYNPQTGPGAGDSNLSWSVSLSQFKGDRAAAGQPPLPFNIGEYGLYDNPDTLDDNGNTIPKILSDTLAIGAATDGLTGIALWGNDAAKMVATSPKTTAWKQFVTDSKVIKV